MLLAAGSSRSLLSARTSTGSSYWHPWTPLVSRDSPLRQVAAFAYDSVIALIAAVRAAGRADTQSIIAALRSNVTFEGATGAVVFTPDGDRDPRSLRYVLHNWIAAADGTLESRLIATYTPGQPTLDRNTSIGIVWPGGGTMTPADVYDRSSGSRRLSKGAVAVLASLLLVAVAACSYLYLLYLRGARELHKVRHKPHQAALKRVMRCGRRRSRLLCTQLDNYFSCCAAARAALNMVLLLNMVGARGVVPKGAARALCQPAIEPPGLRDGPAALVIRAGTHAPCGSSSADDGGGTGGGGGSAGGDRWISAERYASALSFNSLSIL